MARQHQRGRRRIAAAALATLAAFVATPRPSFAEPPPATQPAAPVVTPGVVAAFYVTDLYAKDSGYVADVSADIGDHVTKGKTLAVIADPELKQQVAGAKAMLNAKRESAKAAEAAIEQAKAAVEVAKRQLAGSEADRGLAMTTLKRQEALFAGKAATSQQMDEIRAKAQVAEAAADVGRAKIAAAEADYRAADANRAVAAAQVKVARAEAERTKALYEYTKVVAPFDGVVTRRNVNPGDLVQAAAGRTPALFTIQKLDVVRVFCEVPEASAAAIRPGIKAEVRLFGPAGVTVQGTVTRIATAVDPATRTMRAEIDLPNSAEAMRPGMYAQVTLTPGTAPPETRPATQPTTEPAVKK